MATSTATPPPVGPENGALAAYEALAPYYDAYTHDYPHERWLRDLERLAIRHGLRGRRLLDVACGTGKSTLPLARRGYRACACDLSPAMVAVARERLEQVGVLPLVADMRALPWRGAFDLVTCLDDAVNYLLTEADLRSAIASMARALAPGGVLVFDVNTLRTYRSAFAGESAVGAGEVTVRWHGEADASAAAGAICSATIELLGAERRSASRHVQRHHPRAEIESAIRSAGLEPCAAHGLRPGGRIAGRLDEARDVKAIFIARRPTGGEEVSR